MAVISGARTKETEIENPIAERNSSRKRSFSEIAEEKSLDDRLSEKIGRISLNEATATNVVSQRTFGSAFSTFKKDKKILSVSSSALR